MAARWTSLVTGLKALFNTDPEFVSRQIRGRCAAVAAELGIDLNTVRGALASRMPNECATWHQPLPERRG
jgi:hypothetical protein